MPDSGVAAPGSYGARNFNASLTAVDSLGVGVARSNDRVESLLAEYPYLERDDILEAQRYAAWRAEEREVSLSST